MFIVFIEVLIDPIIFEITIKNWSYRNQSKITLLKNIVGKLYNTIQEALYNANWLEMLLTVWHTISKGKFILILFMLFLFVWQVHVFTKLIDKSDGKWKL